MSYNHIVIPVADAQFEKNLPSSSPAGVMPPLDAKSGGVVFVFLAGWILVHFTAFGFMPGLDVFVRLLQVARYLLWPAIILALVVHVARTGGRDFAGVVAPIMPYFFIGIIAGIVGTDPVGSARLLVFWFLGVTGAAVIGLEVTGKSFRQALLALFSAMIFVSIAIAVLKPEIGLELDNRVSGGTAWRGFFPGKNSLGLICIYGILMTIFVENCPSIIKYALFVIFGLVLYLARSQGAVAAAAAVVVFCLLVAMLRRSSLSPMAKSSLLALALLTGVAIMLLGYRVVFDLLGRDATLTGRSEIWPLWLARAMTNWPIGYGPGSFTQASLITIDLTRSEQNLGAIYTPHNMLIAVFGEVGLFGLIAYVAPLLYFSFVLPFARTSSAAFFAGATAFTTLVSGISETREVFGLGMNMFLIIATYANSRRHDALRAAEAAPSGPAPAYVGVVALGS